MIEPIDVSSSIRLPKLVVLATWVLFAITVAMDSRVANVVLLQEMDVVLAAWIFATVGGLVGSAIALRGWPQWWKVCGAAAFILVLTDILYLYDVFWSEPDKSLVLGVHDIWKTLWHSLQAGAFAVAYRELFMPLIQLAILAYFTWGILERPKTQS